MNNTKFCTVVILTVAIVCVFAFFFAKRSSAAASPMTQDLTSADKLVYVSVSKASENSSVTLVEPMVTAACEMTGKKDENAALISVDPSENLQDEIRAVWVASVFNLDLPSQSGLSSNELICEVDTLIENAKSNDINTLFFQVRPSSDAMYYSKIFPTSHFLTKEQGKDCELDLLDYMVYKAHLDNISVFAWINPYRVSVSSMDIESLDKDNPASLHPEWIYEAGGGYYYNPAIPEVRDLVCDGVREVCANYGVDGIIFDDYFYAEGIDLADEKEYEKYAGDMSLSEFRRSQVNLLIEKCYKIVKNVSENILFGVSPRGIWRNKSEDEIGSDTHGGSAYDEIYCDALAWIKGGYVDIISPQIYWSFESKAAPFGTLADWWNENVKSANEEYGNKVKLVISLAAYSQTDDEIAKQKEYIKHLEAYFGYSLYAASSVFE